MIHLKKERTFVILKPDAVQRGLVGEIVQRFERIGLKIVAMKMHHVEEEKLWAHYNKDDAWYEKKGKNIVENKTKLGMPVEKEAIEYGKDIIRAMVHFMTASPVVSLVLEGNQAQAVVALGDRWCPVCVRRRFGCLGHIQAPAEYRARCSTRCRIDATRLGHRHWRRPSE